jgi:hypothetical protein
VKAWQDRIASSAGLYGGSRSGLPIFGESMFSSRERRRRRANVCPASIFVGALEMWWLRNPPLDDNYSDLVTKAFLARTLDVDRDPLPAAERYQDDASTAGPIPKQAVIYLDWRSARFAGNPRDAHGKIEITRYRTCSGAPRAENGTGSEAIHSSRLGRTGFDALV